MKSATYRPGQPTKKKRPSAQCRKADEIYLRLQKSAPFPTRQWLHVLCISFRCKNSFSGHDEVKPIHPSTKRHVNGVTRLRPTPIVISKINLQPSGISIPSGAVTCKTYGVVTLRRDRSISSTQKSLAASARRFPSRVPPPHTRAMRPFTDKSTTTGDGS